MQESRIQNPTMEELLALYAAPVQPKHAQLIEGEVVRIDARLGAWIDFGGKCDALLPADELATAELKPGDRRMFQVVDVPEDEGIITVSARRAAGWLSMRKRKESGDTISVRITRVIGNSGVRVQSEEGLHGFVPMSMLGMRKGIDVDQPLEVKVAEVEPESRRLIFDHIAVRRERAAAARAAEAAREERFQQVKVGDIIENGTVVKVTEYGLFVDIGSGLNGLLHKKELPARHGLTVGSTVKVRVVRAEKSDEGKRLVALSLKRTERSPLLDKLNAGDIVPGTVSKIVAYGVFVTLSEGAEGLVHISELPSAIRYERRTLKVGEGVLVRVTDVDKEKNRISLSLKDVPATPSAPQASPVA